MKDKYDETKFKDYVDDKIRRYTFWAKNFTQKDMDLVDVYCKKYFGNDRRKMILSLIAFAENDVRVNLLDDKINLISEKFITEIEALSDRIKQVEKEEDKPKEKISWKGFSKE